MAVDGDVAVALTIAKSIGGARDGRIAVRGRLILIECQLDWITQPRDDQPGRDEIAGHEQIGLSVGCREHKDAQRRVVDELRKIH